MWEAVRVQSCCHVRKWYMVCGTCYEEITHHQFWQVRQSKIALFLRNNSSTHKNDGNICSCKSNYICLGLSANDINNMNLLSLMGKHIPGVWYTIYNQNLIMVWMRSSVGFALILWLVGLWLPIQIITFAIVEPCLNFMLPFGASAKQLPHIDQLSVKFICTSFSKRF